MLHAAHTTISLAIATLLLAAPFISATSGILLWRMRKLHRVFTHMAALKFGLTVGILALIISETDPSKHGLAIRLTGWHGAWFVAGLCAIILPLGALTAFLMGLKNGH